MISGSEEKLRPLLPLYSMIKPNHAFKKDQRRYKLIFESSRGWLVVPRECYIRKIVEQFSNTLLASRGYTLMPYCGRTSSTESEDEIDEFITTPEDNIRYMVHHFLDWFHKYPVPDMIKPGRVRIDSNIHRALTLQSKDELPMACINYKIMLDKNVSFIDTLSTYSLKQGQGIGSILLAIGIYISALYGCYRVCLYTSAKGRAMYEKFGFTLYNNEADGLELFLDNQENLKVLEQSLIKHAKCKPGFKEGINGHLKLSSQLLTKLRHFIVRLQPASINPIMRNRVIAELKEIEKQVVIPPAFYEAMGLSHLKPNEVMTDSDQYDDDVSHDSDFEDQGAILEYDLGEPEEENASEHSELQQETPSESDTQSKSQEISESSDFESPEFKEMITAIHGLVNDEETCSRKYPKR